ncbi:hypothetical protein EYF80_049039 [Liparis tanakae]|uniref:Uncharacterized protein n=1 Tax=Liparis tanakae TaxID=230148 RepID=A0A4Z2FI13_9TELE|nr:hypothetical protein EYF80_049039 [Liparis tanakae]
MQSSTMKRFRRRRAKEFQLRHLAAPIRSWLLSQDVPGCRTREAGYRPTLYLEAVPPLCRAANLRSYAAVNGSTRILVRICVSIPFLLIFAGSGIEVALN